MIERACYRVIGLSCFLLGAIAMEWTFFYYRESDEMNRAPVTKAKVSVETWSVDLHTTIVDETTQTWSTIPTILGE